MSVVVSGGKSGIEITDDRNVIPSPRPHRGHRALVLSEVLGVWGREEGSTEKREVEGPRERGVREKRATVGDGLMLATHINPGSRSSRPAMADHALGRCRSSWPRCSQPVGTLVSSRTR